MEEERLFEIAKSFKVTNSLLNELREIYMQNAKNPNK